MDVTTLKLSERAKLLLSLVDNACEVDWTTGEVHRFFVPQAREYHLPDGGFTYISGAGDANALKGLARKGLIERPLTSLTAEYCYVITEAGRMALEHFRHNS